METIKINYRVEQIYLEIARSIIDKPLNDVKNFYNNRTGLNKTFALQPYYNALFAITSTTCIYSYAALEAFCNSHIRSLKLQPKEQEQFLKKWSVLRKLEKIAKGIYDKSLKNNKPDLWFMIEELVRDARHFFVHPKSDEFNSKVKKFLENNAFDEYVKVATETMEYFYQTPQIWLSHNILLNFKGLQVTGGVELHYRPSRNNGASKNPRK